jgi:type IV pilus assembly protein PilC
MANEQMVMDYLYFKGMTSIELKLLEKNAFQKAMEMISGIKENVLLLFLRQMSVVIKAGIPIYKALDLIILQTEDKRLKTVCQAVKNDIGEGSSLSNSFRGYPNIFSDFLVSMIAVGESKGELEYSLMQVVEFLEASRELKNKIISAAIYPVILIGAGILIMIAMVTFVLPRFMEIFVSYNVKLPMPTVVLITVSNIILHYYAYIIMSVISFVVAIYFIDKTPWGRFGFDWLKLHIIIFGPITHNVAISRFVRTLGVLHRGGVPLIRALELSAGAADNTVVAKEVKKVIESVKDGKGIAAPLGESKIFPSLMVQMLGIGEESGSLDVMALEMADYYDQETDYKIKRQMAMMEPAALVIIAVGVGFISASFLLPMFGMATSLRQGAQ